ncbi:MAG: hypothetical protein L0323_20385 [Planctomycetes bacterium]|nr:hypothetical protein [Planctomycetota bacterium]
MGRIAVALAFVFLSAAGHAQSPIVMAAETHADSFTVMNLGGDPIVLDFLPMPASEVDHSVLGTFHTLPSLGYWKFHLPPEIAAFPLSFRVHQARCDGARCAGGATDLVPAPSSVRDIVIRDDGAALRKTVFDVAWDASGNVTYCVSANELPSVPFDMVLTDGIHSKTITVDGFSVNPGSQLVVVNPPPLVPPTDGILDPSVEVPGVLPTGGPWVVTQTFHSPF